MSKDSVAWKAVALAAGAASAAITRRVLSAAWRRVQGGNPPLNPASRSTTWAQALMWAVTSGVALAVTRLVAQRGAAAVWQAKTGSNPPGLEAVS